MTSPERFPQATVRPARRTWIAVAQLFLLALVLFLAGRALLRQWNQVSQAARSLEPSWIVVLASASIVLLTYAVLVESWRLLIRSGGSELGYGAAVRIWTVSNLGRYLPGKVWSIGALGVLGKRAGVSAAGAAGAAVLGTILNIGAGFGVAAVASMSMLQAMPDWLRAGVITGSVLFVIGLLLLPVLLPLAIRVHERARKLPAAERGIPISSVWVATIVNICSWFLYGIAFWVFSRGVTPDVAGNPLQFVTVFTASYLAGYLALFAPGGLGVREAILASLLVAFEMASPGDAWLLSLLSRLWLTVLEVAPGLVGLFLLTDRERGAAPVGR